MNKKILISLAVILAGAIPSKAEKRLQIFRGGEIISEFAIEDIDYLEINDIEEPGDVDLSRVEMANCYIVQSPGNYKFKADNQFNLGEGLPVPPEIHPEGARLLWQTAKGSIASVSLENDDNGSVPYIHFEVAQAKGNALIAATDNAGNVLWSWHIWMPEETVTSVHTSTGYELMTLNLGASNNTPGDAASYGMLYQWGRKDPFPASATLTGNTATLSAPMYDIDGNEVKLAYSSWYDTTSNNLAYSFAHPTTVLSNYAQYSASRDWLAAAQSDDSLWGNPGGDSRDSETGKYVDKGRKTCYDPSPAGWRVAPPDVFSDYTTSGGYSWTFDDFNIADYNSDGLKNLDDYLYGWHFMANADTPLYFPAASRFDGSYAMLMGSMSGLWGNYWSNSPHSSMSGGAFCALSFSVKDQNGSEFISVSPAAASSRADAFSVRCIRDVKENR